MPRTYSIILKSTPGKQSIDGLNHCTHVLFIVRSMIRVELLMPQVSTYLIELISWPTRLTGWNRSVHSFNQTKPMAICITQMPKTSAGNACRRNFLSTDTLHSIRLWRCCACWIAGNIRRFRAAACSSAYAVYTCKYIYRIDTEYIQSSVDTKDIIYNYSIIVVIVGWTIDDRINRSAQSGNRNHRIRTRTAACDIMGPILLANLLWSFWLAGCLQIRK